MPAEQLFFHSAPYSAEVVCGYRPEPPRTFPKPRERVLRYSSDWAQGGPLIEKHRTTIRAYAREFECDLDYGCIATGYGVTALEPSAALWCSPRLAMTSTRCLCTRHSATHPNNRRPRDQR